MKENYEEKIKSMAATVSDLVIVVGRTEEEGMRKDISDINESLRTIHAILKIYQKLFPY